MKIVHYPHPTLRAKSEPVKKVDTAFKKAAHEMIELMHEHDGVGLAANQVDIPQRFFVMNFSPDADNLVFINPVVSKHHGSEEEEEGCLSLPGVYAQVKRPKAIHLNAHTMDGNEINVTLQGMTARIVQHETDHLDGVLFIDKLQPSALIDIKHLLEEFELAFKK